MSRWDPDARGRLERAAFDLFLERGYDHTTVADISTKAGLTERTFFRHFVDKREVLFARSATLLDVMSNALEQTDPELLPIEAVRVAVEAISKVMYGRLSYARQRQQVIAAHPDLQERDLNKRAALTAALELGLRRRGAPDSTANVAAETGIGIFYGAFVSWLGASRERELVDIVHERFEELKVVTSAL